MDTDHDLAEIIARIDSERVELPAFPDVVNRLQMMLANADVSMKDVAALIQSDPVLTAKLLRTANSAAFNTRGVEIENLNVALNRLGGTLIRSVAMAFAMRQAEQEPYLAPIKGQMRELLRRSNYVAAIACVVARALPQVNADQAILAGLVHQIGALYLMITVQRDYPEITENLDYFEAVARQGAAAAAPVLNAWAFPAEVRQAVAEQDGLLHPPNHELSPVGLLLAAAKLRDQMENDPLLRDDHPDADEKLAAVRFNERNFLDIVAASQNEIRDIQESLSFNLAGA
ncbi:MAG: HDOD domain-containing protein [Gammaproteobacteria bacterium]|nr:HDOD domain-containing protein [Gammaproteobacteria bacterium]